MEEWKPKKRALELCANYASYTHLEPLWSEKIESALALRMDLVAGLDGYRKSDRGNRGLWSDQVFGIVLLFALPGGQNYMAPGARNKKSSEREQEQRITKIHDCNEIWSLDAGCWERGAWCWVLAGMNWAIAMAGWLGLARLDCAGLKPFGLDCAGIELTWDEDGLNWAKARLALLM